MTNKSNKIIREYKKIYRRTRKSRTPRKSRKPKNHRKSKTQRKSKRKSKKNSSIRVNKKRINRKNTKKFLNNYGGFNSGEEETDMFGFIYPESGNILCEKTIMFDNSFWNPEKNDNEKIKIDFKLYKNINDLKNILKKMRLPFIALDAAGDGYKTFMKINPIYKINNHKHFHGVAMFVNNERFPFIIVGLIIETDAKIAYPIGIEKNISLSEYNSKLKNGSLLLHSFWAQAISKIYPDIKIGITWPVGAMLHNFIKKSFDESLPISIGYKNDIEAYWDYKNKEEFSPALQEWVINYNRIQEYIKNLNLTEDELYKKDIILYYAYVENKTAYEFLEERTNDDNIDNYYISNFMKKIQDSKLYYLKGEEKINNMLKHQWDFDPITKDVTLFYEDGSHSKFNIFELQSFSKGGNQVKSLSSSYKHDSYWNGPAISWKNQDLANLIKEVIDYCK